MGKTYVTKEREEEKGELLDSRPKHKQDKDVEKSGRGKVDYIFVNGVGKNLQLVRDPKSKEAMSLSAKPMTFTFTEGLPWRADHDYEGFTIKVNE